MLLGIAWNIVGNYDMSCMQFLRLSKDAISLRVQKHRTYRLIRIIESVCIDPPVLIRMMAILCPISNSYAHQNIIVHSFLACTFQFHFLLIRSILQWLYPPINLCQSNTTQIGILFECDWSLLSRHSVALNCDYLLTGNDIFRTVTSSSNIVVEQILLQNDVIHMLSFRTMSSNVFCFWCYFIVDVNNLIVQIFYLFI